MLSSILVNSSSKNKPKAIAAKDKPKATAAPKKKAATAAPKKKATSMAKPSAPEDPKKKKKKQAVTPPRKGTAGKKKETAAAAKRRTMRGGGGMVGVDGYATFGTPASAGAAYAANVPLMALANAGSLMGGMQRNDFVIAGLDNSAMAQGSPFNLHVGSPFLQ